MALVRRFEDLAAWQEARRLSNHVYRLTKSGQLAADRSFADQVRRAALSTVTNVAEGFGSGTKPEFCRFLRYAIRSAVEVQGCLYVALDQQYVSQAEFDATYASAERLKSLCSALVRRLREKPATSTEPDRVAESSPAWPHVPRGRCRAVASGVPHVSTSARQHVSTPEV